MNVHNFGKEVSLYFGEHKVCNACLVEVDGVAHLHTESPWPQLWAQEHENAVYRIVDGEEVYDVHLAPLPPNEKSGTVFVYNPVRISMPVEIPQFAGKLVFA